MWESDYVVDEGDNLHDEAVNIGSRKSSIFLNKAVSSNIDSLPLPLLTAWQMKRTMLRGEQQEHMEQKLCCRHCGLMFKSKRTFSLRISVNKKGDRMLRCRCNGCNTAMFVGKLSTLAKPNIEADNLNLTQSDSMDGSFLSPMKPVQASTPVLKSKMSSQPSTPVTKNITPNLNSMVKSKAKKKKGSALARLLQEDESESDRSLNSFLSSFSSQ